MYRSLEKGLSFKVGGGRVVTLCPPLTIHRSELFRAFEIVVEALTGL